MTKVSVIIPAFNESEVIDECLQSLVDQNFSDFKAFIVDDASTDDTKKRILKFSTQFPQRIELLEFGKVGPGRARNLAAQKVKSEIVVFMDADCKAATDWLSEIVKTYEYFPDSASVGGPQRAFVNSTSFQKSVEKFFSLSSRFTDFFQKTGTEIRTVNHNPLCNTSYKRDLFLKLGGFREDLFPGEDIELDLRLKDRGEKIKYNPQALVFHHRPETIEQFKKVMFAYGRAQGKLVRERGIERRVQIVGLLLLIPALLFFPRPKWNTFFGIVLNSLDWANGFLEGFWTNRSDPPWLR